MADRSKAKDPPIRFCETNPPFWLDFIDGSSYVYACYNRKVEIFSVGSFWKTNPPGEAFLEAFIGCEQVF